MRKTGSVRRASARIAWYSLESCRMLASLARFAAAFAASTPVCGSIFASSRRRAKLSSAFKSLGETSVPLVNGVASKSRTESHDTLAVFATNVYGGASTVDAMTSEGGHFHGEQAATARAIPRRATTTGVAFSLSRRRTQSTAMDPRSSPPRSSLARAVHGNRVPSRVSPACPRAIRCLTARAFAADAPRQWPSRAPRASGLRFRLTVESRRDARRGFKLNHRLRRFGRRSVGSSAGQVDRRDRSGRWFEKN